MNPKPSLRKNIIKAYSLIALVFLICVPIIIALVYSLLNVINDSSKYEQLPIIYSENGKNEMRVYIIDSCEYIGSMRVNNNDLITHKGNCKFCVKRNQEFILKCLKNLNTKELTAGK